MTSEQFDAVIVGAGFGGIGAAIQLKRMGIENFVILDREDDLGGTWHINHYPGLAVDVPTTTYSYFFEPNPNWSRLFSTGSEIKQYANDVADKYDVRTHMRFNTTVDGARWDEEAKVWCIALAGGETLTARYLITATGFLSQPKTPDIPGITGFAGKVIHTTDWDDSYRTRGQAGRHHRHRRHRGAAHSRTRQEGRGPDGVSAHPDLGGAQARLRASPSAQSDFSHECRWRSGPSVAHRRALRVLRFRRVCTKATSPSAAQRRGGRPVQDTPLRLGPRQGVRKQLTPDYDFGCKRPTFSNDYYRMFNKPHVHLQSSGIERIEPDAIVSSDGTRTPIDTLVLATGFDLWEANFPAIEIVGREGRNLGKWWRDTRFQAYQGVTVPYFPNYLSMASPYAFLGLNFFNTMEYQMRHMDRLFGEVKRRGATTFEVTEDANTRYLDRMTELIGDSVFIRGNCATSRSYYFNPQGEPNLLRPMSTRTAIKEASEYPLSDYQIA